MRHLIKILILLLLSFQGYSQSIVTRSQPPNTVLDPRLYVSKNFRPPVYADTTEANLTGTTTTTNKGLDSAGSMIFTRDVQGYWLRQGNPKKWVRTFTNTNLICGVSVVNSSTLQLCFCGAGCFTVTVTITVTPQLVYVKNDSTVTICDSLQHCQDVTIPKQQFSIYQNEVVNRPNNIIEFGSNTPFGDNPLIHDTYLWTHYNKFNIVAWNVYNYALQVSQDFWAFEDGTGMQSWLGKNYRTPTNLDYNNLVRLGINYTSSIVADTGSLTFPGYFRNSIGYFLGTNATGNGSFGLRVDDPLSKFGGAFFNTFDTLSRAVITIYGGAPPHTNFIAPINSGQTLDSNKIAEFWWDKQIKWYGYDSLRNDYTTSKALFVDANGVMKYGTINATAIIDTFTISTRKWRQKLADSLDAVINAFNYVPATRTLTHSSGWGIGVTGGTQDLSANRTWSYLIDSFSVASRLRVQKGIDSVAGLIKTYTGSNAITLTANNFTWEGALTKNTVVGASGETHTLTINAASYIVQPSGITLDSTKTRVLVMDGSTGLIYYRPASSIGTGGGGSGSVTEVTAGNLSPLFTTSVATSTTTPVISFTATSAAALKWFGNNTGSSAASAFNSIGTLSKMDDTNVTLTLGGSPTTALLNSTSLTLGWTGVLSIARGGTNNGSLSVTNGSLLYADGSKVVSLGIGTANQILRTNGAGTLPEWYTPSFGTVTSFSSGNLSPIFTTSVATSTSTPALTFALSNAAAFSYLGNGASVSGSPSYTTASGITKTDDTNVTLTLAGTYTSSVLQPVSLTLGWTGSLSIARGGTNNGSLSVTQGAIYYGDGTKLVALAPGTNGQFLQTQGTGANPQWATLSGGGSVSSFSAGNLSPLFTTSVATATTTPALSFSLSSAASTSIFGNFTNSSTTPSFNAATADGQLLVRRSGALTFGTLVASDIPISLTTTGSSGVATYSSSTGVLNIPNYVTPPAGSNKQIQFNNSGVFGASGNFTWDNSIAQEEITGNQYVHTSATNSTAGTYSSFAATVYNWNTPTSQSNGAFFGSGSVLTDEYFNANMTLNAAAINTSNQNTLRLGSTNASTVTVQQISIRALSANAVSVNLLQMPSALGSSIDWVAGMQIYAVLPPSSGLASNLMMTVTNYIGLLLADSREYANVSANITNSYGIYQKGTSDKNLFNGQIVLNNVPTYSSGGYNLAVVNTGSGRVESITAGSIGAAGSVYGETPTGTLNGSNVTFTIANTPITGTVRVYLNGQRMPSGYSVSGTTITFTTAPISTDNIIVDYNK